MQYYEIIKYDTLQKNRLSYLKFKDNHYGCHLFRSDELILVTGPQNYAYPQGITDDQIMALPLIRENLSRVSDKDWFDKIYSNASNHFLSIGTGTKIVPYLKSGLGYGFVVDSFVTQELQDGHLIRIPLLDRENPVLNSYMIYRESDSHAKKLFVEFAHEWQI